MDERELEIRNAAQSMYYDDSSSCIVFKEGAEWSDSHPKRLFNAENRGTIDEIIMALTTLGEEKMISYTKEIDFLKRIRGL